MSKRSRAATVVSPIASLTYPPPRSIELTPEDWLWACWRPRNPQPRPAPQPFDRQAALARLDQITAGNQPGHCNWAEAAISVSLSSEEALFWFLAITGMVPRREGYEIVKQDLAALSLTDYPALDQVLATLNTLQIYAVAPELIIPLANLFSWPDLMDLLSDDRLFQPYPIDPPDWSAVLPGLAHLLPPNLPTFPTHRLFDWRILHELVKGFRRYILPYLSQAEVVALQTHLRPKLDLAQWALYPNVSERVGLFLLAAALGMHAELLPLVESWTEDSCRRDYYHLSQEVIFGLTDPTLVEYHIRRLKRQLTPPQVYAWLAHTEHTALDYVQEQLLEPQIAQRLNVPEAAPFMLELTLSYRGSSQLAPKVARQWLQTHPAQAIAGLVPLVTGRDRLAEAAIDFLRLMQRSGYESYLQQCLKDQPPEIAHKVNLAVLEYQDLALFEATSLPEWWQQICAQYPTLKKAKLPTWLNPLELPPIVLEPACLNPEQVTHVLIALKQSTLSTLHPLITALKLQAHPAALDLFAWKLFEIWLCEGAPPKDNWAMIAVGLFGNDTSVLKLAPLIQKMPGEGHHKRAVLGLECLRTIGTDTALMQINTIAQKVKYKSLQKKAEACMVEIAQIRNLTREQLEDRIVPDCGLDQRGSRVFDYGSRHFCLVFSSELQPMIRDRDGKLKSNLPKPKTGDDSTMAALAIAEWKLLKQQLQTVIKTQTDRLEKAMLNQRRWHPSEFQACLVQHPLMTNLVQRLVWGVYQGAELCQSFRVTEDLTYADEQDQTLELTTDASIGLVHPAQLSQSLRNTWGELWSDYELIQPFRQLSRSLFQLEVEEADRPVFNRFQHVHVPVAIMAAILDKTGWRSLINPEQQSQYHCKPFAFADLTAVLEHPNGFYGSYGAGGTRMPSCYFVPGVDWMPETLHLQKALPLNQVNPVVVSEVLRTLGAIAAKGEQN